MWNASAASGTFRQYQCQPMSFLTRLLDRSTNTASAVAGVFVVVMMLHIVADVLSKWLFNYPIVGTLEIVANYYMVALIFFPLAYVQRAGGHIIVEIFTQSLAKRVILVFDAAIGLFMFAYTILFVWRTGVEAIHRTEELEYLQGTGLFITIWPVRWFLPLGFGVMGLIALRQVFASVRALLQKAE